jgi:enoyl-CoA hydratase/carnithine racemase
MENPEAPVLFERIGEHIALVTLNRPAQRNAVNGALARLLEDYVWQIEADKTIRAGILYASSDRSFCAGADLAEVSAGRVRELFTEKGGFAGFAYAKRQKPWIAAVRGFALGGGLELSLACDMIVAGDSASFGLPEVRRGIIAGAGGAYRLPLAIPRAIALEMVATGVPISAARAYELGLVNRLVPDAAVRETAVALAEAVAEGAPVSVRESLKVARVANEHSEADLQAMLAAGVAAVEASADYQEGPRAFVEKRKPVWQG